jgi:hypothetical protein
MKQDARRNLHKRARRKKRADMKQFRADKKAPAAANKQSAS